MIEGEGDAVGGVEQYAQSQLVDDLRVVFEWKRNDCGIGSYVLMPGYEIRVDDLESVVASDSDSPSVDQCEGTRHCNGRKKVPIAGVDISVS